MRRRISPATAISLVALFFALTGAGMAATGYRITSLWQIAPKVRHALRGHNGKRGPAGPIGPTGAAGTSIVQTYVRTETTIMPIDGLQDGVATCPADSWVTGGGYGLIGSDMQVLYSEPEQLSDGPQRSWLVGLISRKGGFLDVYAVCAKQS